MSCVRGTLKQVIGLYKAYLRASSSCEQNEKLIDPLLCMNIICPAGSYDVNIEPAKDDVLFMDPTKFLDIIETFLKDIYGEQLNKAAFAKEQSQHKKSKQHGFQLLLNRRPHDLPRSPLDFGHNQDDAGCATAVHNSRHVPENDSLDVTLESRDDNNKTLEIQTTTNRYQASDTGSALALDLDDVRSGFTNDQAQTWRSTMYGNGEGDLDDLDGDVRDQDRSRVDDESDDDVALRDVNVSNPWTIAKVNAPIRRAQNNQTSNASNCGNGQLLTPAKQRGEAEGYSPEGELAAAQRLGLHGQALPTSRETHSGSTLNLKQSLPSPTTFSFPMKAWGKGEGHTNNRKSPKLAREEYGNGALDTWVQKSMNNRTPTGQPSIEEESVREDYTHGPSIGFVSARTLQTGTPLSDIPEAPQRRSRKTAARREHQQGSANGPLNSANSDPDRVWFEMEANSQPQRAQKARVKSVRDAIVATAPIRSESEEDDTISKESPARLGLPTIRPMHPDLTFTMDYEMRKQAAMQKRKEHIRQQANFSIDARGGVHSYDSAAETTNSPHKNRYNKAVAALNPSNGPSEAPVSLFGDNDPRAYLIRLQQQKDPDPKNHSRPSGRNHTLKQRKTALLPLETIPAEQTIQHLIFTIDTPPSDLTHLAKKLAAHDEYIRSGATNDRLTCTNDDAKIWADALHTMMKDKKLGNDGDVRDVVIDVEAALHRHMSANDI